MPPCAGPIKARPFGWPRRTRPALTGPAHGGCEFCGRDERMLASRVEPKNRRKFKPLVLGQYQTAADSWVTVDDTGARHAGKNGFCTQIGDDRFTWFGTRASKSRLNFLDLLRAGHTDYVLNDAAYGYMRDQ